MGEDKGMQPSFRDILLQSAEPTNLSAMFPLQARETGPYSMNLFEFPRISGRVLGIKEDMLYRPKIKCTEQGVPSNEGGRGLDSPGSTLRTSPQTTGSRVTKRGRPLHSQCAVIYGCRGRRHVGAHVATPRRPRRCCAGGHYRRRITMDEIASRLSSAISASQDASGHGGLRRGLIYGRPPGALVVKEWSTNAD
ncbi:hypothetical protein AAFF_G00058480 [Aldrovandia affinis]|uniref:Uncharacterized protein n=1 Tax=Aldrovandia affinis TaxID=143900 RepID=A0AAD7WF39_9TELE|nr:hypothetical protein AAFF_G00058480 [Aldrovandia affinis]